MKIMAQLSVLVVAVPMALTLFGALITAEWLEDMKR